MRILFLTHFVWPHVGGVEKHVNRVVTELRQNKHKVEIISEKNIKYSHIKFIGLLFIWFWLFRNRSLIKRSDIVHIHDVFIWYLPYRFLFPKKVVFTTFHGGQGKWPIPIKDKLLIKIAAKLSKRTICVGNFIPKYFGIKTDQVIYGGVDKNENTKIKKEKLIIFLGRLERETGLNEFINKIKSKKNYTVEFIGDGTLRSICEEHGIVRGFCDPIPFLKKASICFAGGYLSALEALEYRCELWTGANTPVKIYYWKTFPYKKGDILPTWNDVGKIYENIYLYNS